MASFRDIRLSSLHVLFQVDLACRLEVHEPVQYARVRDPEVLYRLLVVLIFSHGHFYSRVFNALSCKFCQNHAITGYLAQMMQPETITWYFPFLIMGGKGLGALYFRRARGYSTILW
jgi:hypothetical protein